MADKKKTAMSPETLAINRVQRVIAGLPRDSQLAVLDFVAGCIRRSIPPCQTAPPVRDLFSHTSQDSLDHNHA